VNDDDGGACAIDVDGVEHVDRVTPRCRHFGPPDNCGGCTWQHIAYADQLRLKTALVDRLVRASVPRAPAARPTLPSTPLDNPWGYRHKVHFVFGAAREARGARGPRLIMGHYVRGSRQVFEARECPVHDARGNTIAFRFAHTFQEAGIHAAAPAGRGVLRSLAIRVGTNTGETMAALVVSSDADRRLRAATRRATEGHPDPSSLHVNLHPKGGAFIFGAATKRIAGRERMRETVAGASFLISPTAFFQTNVHAAEILVRLVLEAVPAGARILDLYAGAGLFAIPLARAGHDVVAVEESRAAVADGEAARRLNKVPDERCRFVARRVESALAGELKAAAPRRDAPAAWDVVILDPPREGCTPSVLDGIFGRVRPPRAVYISCNPEALARDLRVVASHGYAIESLQPVDMFPHTAHVETVAVLTRASTDAGRAADRFGR
jgi:23S rRNA (uracil1939-C5)-methyltransferase